MECGKHGISITELSFWRVDVEHFWLYNWRHRIVVGGPSQNMARKSPKWSNIGQSFKTMVCHMPIAPCFCPNSSKKAGSSKSALFERRAVLENSSKSKGSSLWTEFYGPKRFKTYLKAGFCWFVKTHDSRILPWFSNAFREKWRWNIAWKEEDTCVHRRSMYECVNRDGYDFLDMMSQGLGGQHVLPWYSVNVVFAYSSLDYCCDVYSQHQCLKKRKCSRPMFWHSSEDKVLTSQFDNVSSTDCATENGGSGANNTISNVSTRWSGGYYRNQ